MHPPTVAPATTAYEAVNPQGAVAARRGDRVRISAGILRLGPDEAWLLGDNGALSFDSRRYGPVPLEALVGRAWFRYGPPNRIGLISRRRAVKPDR